MAFSERLAARVRAAMSPDTRFEERRMFGGLSFLVNGNVGCGILEERLMIRVPREEYDSVLREPHVRVMDFTGRPMRGFVTVDGDGIREDEDLRRWVARGMGYAASLSPK